MDKFDASALVSAEDVKRILAIGKPFLELKDRLEKDLKATGFNPANNPPSVEPSLPAKLSVLTDDGLRDLYDDFLKYYDYLTDQITRCEVYLGTTKERAAAIYAAIKLEAAQDDRFKNAEARNSFVDVHPAYLAAMQDYLYFKQFHAAQEERRKKISKSIERVSRDLWGRSQDQKGLEPRTTFTRVHADNKQRIQNMYKPVSKE